MHLIATSVLVRAYRCIHWFGGLPFPRVNGVRLLPQAMAAIGISPTGDYNSYRIVQLGSNSGYHITQSHMGTSVRHITRLDSCDQLGRTAPGSGRPGGTHDPSVAAADPPTRRLCADKPGRHGMGSAAAAAAEVAASREGLSSDPGSDQWPPGDRRARPPRSGRR